MPNCIHAVHEQSETKIFDEFSSHFKIKSLELCEEFFFESFYVLSFRNSCGNCFVFGVPNPSGRQSERIALSDCADGGSAVCFPKACSLREAKRDIDQLGNNSHVEAAVEPFGEVLC